MMLVAVLTFMRLTHQVVQLLQPPEGWLLQLAAKPQLLILGLLRLVKMQELTKIVQFRLALMQPLLVIIHYQ